MRTRVRSLTKRGSSEGVKDVGREQGAKQFENIITLGSKHTQCGSGIGSHFFRPRFLHLHHRGINDLPRLSVSDTFIHYAPNGPAVDEGIQNSSSRPVEANGHPGLCRPQITPTPDQKCDRAQLSRKLRRTRVQLLRRWDEDHRPGRRRYIQQRPTHDAFEPRVMEG